MTLEQLAERLLAANWEVAVAKYGVNRPDWSEWSGDHREAWLAVAKAAQACAVSDDLREALQRITNIVEWGKRRPGEFEHATLRRIVLGDGSGAFVNGEIDALHRAFEAARTGTSMEPRKDGLYESKDGALRWIGGPVGPCGPEKTTAETCPKCKRAKGSDGVDTCCAERHDGTDACQDNCDRAAAALNECPRCHRMRGTDPATQTDSATGPGRCWVGREPSRSSTRYEAAKACDRAAAEWEAAQAKLKRAREQARAVKELQAAGQARSKPDPIGATFGADGLAHSATNRPIELGDVVELKSGGPRMVVEAARPTLLTCCWFNGGIVEQADFPPEALTRVESK